MSEKLELFIQNHSIEAPTERQEVQAVAEMFDNERNGTVDWEEFLIALKPEWKQQEQRTPSDTIHEEVRKLVMLCTCRQRFRVFQVGEGKYRVRLNFLHI